MIADHIIRNTCTPAHCICPVSQSQCKRNHAAPGQEFKWMFRSDIAMGGNNVIFADFDSDIFAAARCFEVWAFQSCWSTGTFTLYSFRVIHVSYALSLSSLCFLQRLKTLGCTNLDDLAQFDSQLQLSLAAWGYYYEDYIKLSTGVKVLQASRSSRDQDYEVQLVHSLAERRLNEKWSVGEFSGISKTWVASLASGTFAVIACLSSC